MNPAPVHVEAWYRTEGFVSAVAGATLAFSLVVLYEYLRSRRRRRSHFAALRAELELCRELAQTYQRDNVAAPLYRLPTVAYANSLPALLSEASLTERELSRLLAFFNEVESVNRGLDQADTAVRIQDEGASAAFLAAEATRIRLKAQRLAPLAHSPANYYLQAKEVLDARLKWFRL